MEIIGVIIGFLAVKGWNFPHSCITFFMLVELLLVLMKFRNIITQKLYQGRIILMRDECLLNHLKGRVSDLYHKVSKVC